jgi:flagellar hook-associated protein 1 FlgK
MSFFAINIAGSALDAFQVAENVTSDDIANVDTTGASQQVANITQQAPVVASPGYPSYSAPGMTGDGVVVNSITRIHQDSYDSLFRGASSSQNYYTIEQQVLTSVQNAFGEPSGGINTAFANFQTALSTLAASPTTSSDQSQVLEAGQSLTATLNQVGSAISTAQSSAVQQATTTVDTVNGLIDQIASLNGQIRAASAVGANANTFEDERDNDIDQLSQYVATQTSVQANGSTLVTIGGIAVVSDTKVNHLAAPVVTNGANGEPQMVIGMEGDPNPADPSPVPLGSGQLGAYVDLYNNNLTSYATQLNNYASALANTVNSVTEASYDTTGQAGQAFFVPAASGEPITASNITVGLDAASQVTTGLASTEAGDLVVSANAADESIDTASPIIGNTALEYTGASLPPAGTQGQLQVIVNGQTQDFDYDIGATGNSSTINGFINSFNAAQLGVTASWDTTNQSIVFARDPTNEGQALLAAQAANGAPTSPTFEITDSNAASTGTGAGTPSNSILQILGASGLDPGAPGVGITQDASNALGSADSAGTNALITQLSTPVGIPPLQASAQSAILAAGSVTATPSTAGAFANVQVGQLLTIGGGAAIGVPPTVAPSETVQVTAVDPTTGTISFVATLAHGAGYSISSTPSQTLGGYYGALITQLGSDAQTATTGTSTQTNLATSINAQRQSVDGINVDEETQNLIQYQNAYEAAAKTMSVLDTLLQTAIGMISSTTG